MAIPKIDLPIYKLYLQSSNKTINFRPFLVKEEKILLIALESNDEHTILEAIKQAITNCVLEPIEVDDLPMFEIEHLFLNLRARSMGEIVELAYICQNVVDEKTCAMELELEVDLLKVDLDMKISNPIIKFTDTVGIVLKFPTMKSSLSSVINYKDISVKNIKDCTDFLFDANQTYKVEDMQIGEFEEFIDNLTQDKFNNIKDFFKNIPAIKYDGITTCNRCKKEHKIHLEGILDFFE